MASYYVIGATGADGTGGHDGTTPAKAWATVGYAVTHVSAGDTIWVSPSGSPYRISSTIAPSSMASETFLYADTDGSHTGVTGGEVVITAFATNDTTAPAAISVITLASKNNWTIKGFTLVGGTQHVVSISGTSVATKIQDCAIFAQPNMNGVAISPTWNTVAATLVERCRLAAGQYGVWVQLAASASGADYSLGIIVRNCVIMSPFTGVYVAGVANTFRMGGITVANCLFPLVGTGVRVATANPSATYPVLVYNCNIVANVGLNSFAAGGIISDYNLIVATTTYTNVTGGANDQTTARDWRFHMGQEWTWGGQPRPFGMPAAGSPLLGWGTSGSVTVSDDLLGIARPASGMGSTAKALGPFERNNSGTKDSTTYAAAAPSVKISGPGYHDFPLVVRSGNHTITAKLRHDSNYTGTLPTMAVTNGGECGVADASTTDTGGANAWNTVMLAISPTADGIVTVRFISASTAATGTMWIDDLSVS